MSKATELLTVLLEDGQLEDFEPRSRMEAYLKNCCLACGCDGLPEPITETDKLLYALAEKVAGGGGGSGGGDEQSALDSLIDGSITEITSNVTTIWDNAFRDQRNLITVNMPLATQVRLHAFYGCSQLQNINLPSVTSILESGFNGCAQLQAANFPLVTTVKSGTFGNCEQLQSVSLPLLTSLKDGNNFYGCHNLISVDLPLVTQLGASVFSQCWKLKIIDLPKVTNIAYSVFDNDFSLVAVILRSETMCNLTSSSSFTGCNHFYGTVNYTYNPDGLKDGYFYVPAALIENYKAATNWSTFATQFRALEDYTVDGTTTGALDLTKI